jgi:Nucleotidyl transferase AbiEii toxin, Type IV TA system
MAYRTSNDFRSALEQRLANQAAGTGRPVDRLRRLAAFERILARLGEADPGMWVVKGGLALEMRWPSLARTTKDLDLATRLAAPDGDALHEHLITALARDTDGDRFTFVIAPPKHLRSDQAGRPGWRFTVRSELAGREFASVTVEIVQRMEEIAETDTMVAPNSFAFADIPPRTVEMVSAAQHFAEKLHALTRDYGRANTRVRDLVDLSLLIERGGLVPSSVLHAARTVFAARDEHELPAAISDPPVDWAAPYESLALEIGIRAKTVPEAMRALRAFWQDMPTRSEA